MQTVKTSQIVYRLLFQRPISFTSIYFLQPLITQKLFSSPMSLATWSIHSDLKPKSKISLLSYPSSLVYKQRPPLNSSISSYQLGARSLSKRRLFAPQIVYAFCCENCSPLLVDQNAMLCLCWLKAGYLIRLVGVFVFWCNLFEFLRGDWKSTYICRFTALHHSYISCFCTITPTYINFYFYKILIDFTLFVCFDLHTSDFTCLNVHNAFLLFAFHIL